MTQNSITRNIIIINDEIFNILIISLEQIVITQKYESFTAPNSRSMTLRGQMKVYTWQEFRYLFKMREVSNSFLKMVDGVVKNIKGVSKGVMCEMTFSELVELDGLEKVYIPCTKLHPGSIQTMTQLKYLSLKSCKIPPNFCKMFTNLKRLSLYCDNFDVSNISHLTQLEELFLYGISNDDHIVRKLSALKKLRKLLVEYYFVDYSPLKGLSKFIIQKSRPFMTSEKQKELEEMGIIVKHFIRI